MNKKPLGMKSYGSIGHLPNSRLGSGDHCVPDGMADIIFKKTRDHNDNVIITEKLDGSNMSVAKVNGEILALGRAGYLANTSPFEQHLMFDRWVNSNKTRFDALLSDGERCNGEWLAMAHGTRYNIKTDPFIIFDMMVGKDRLSWDEIKTRSSNLFTHVHEIHNGGSISFDKCLSSINNSNHGAIDAVEGFVARVERNGEFDFMAKWVRKDKVDGKYFTEFTGQPEVWNFKI
jgi:hypothetical protein